MPPAGKTVLPMLAAASFLMALDTSVMNVSIAQVANDLGTTVSGVQVAITFYTLVMAALMVTGGKLGALLGRRRAFTLGCIVYGAGSLTTALAPTLPVMLIGWSVLEGVGAALILPATVALVAANFPPERRSAAYGLIAAAGAVAIAAGPLVGGLVTTYFSWRWVFAAEVAVVAVILLVARSVKETPRIEARLDLLGGVLSAAGLAITVLGVLRSSDWGWVAPKPGGPVAFGVSPVIWLLVGGLVLLAAFWAWERRLEESGREPMIRPSMFPNERLSGGLTMFFGQFAVQAGAFFVIPLFLSVVLELSALGTGLRILPLSVALLVAAAGIPRFAPAASPRTVVRLGIGSMLVGVLVMIAGLDPGSQAGIVTVPLLLMGLGMGALASQLGAVTVSAVPDDQAAEVGGLQNTATNLGASLGTALVGAVLLGSLATSLNAGVSTSATLPPSVKEAASVQLVGGVAFVSDSDLRRALEQSDLPPEATDEVLALNREARLVSLRKSLAVVAALALGALFFAGRIPREPVASAERSAASPPG